MTTAPFVPKSGAIHVILPVPPVKVDPQRGIYAPPPFGWSVDVEFEDINFREPLECRLFCERIELSLASWRSLDGQTWEPDQEHSEAYTALFLSPPEHEWNNHDPLTADQTKLVFAHREDNLFEVQFDLDIRDLVYEGHTSDQLAFSIVVPFEGALVFGDDIPEAQRILASHFDPSTFAEPVVDGSFVRFAPRF